VPLARPSTRRGRSRSRRRHRVLAIRARPPTSYPKHDCRTVPQRSDIHAAACDALAGTQDDGASPTSGHEPSADASDGAPPTRHSARRGSEPRRRRTRTSGPWLPRRTRTPRPSRRRSPRSVRRRPGELIATAAWGR
jgi:hypothetical protein